MPRWFWGDLLMKIQWKSYSYCMLLNAFCNFSYIIHCFVQWGVNTTFWFSYLYCDADWLEAYCRPLQEILWFIFWENWGPLFICQSICDHCLFIMTIVFWQQELITTESNFFNWSAFHVLYSESAISKSVFNEIVP